MVVFLSTGMLKRIVRGINGGWLPSDTPAAIVYKATWPEEKRYALTVAGLAEAAERENITKTALIVVGMQWHKMVTTGQNCMIRIYNTVPYGRKLPQRENGFGCAETMVPETSMPVRADKDAQKE